MNRSIRKKFAMLLVVLILSVILLGVLFNTFFLEGFYVLQNKSLLIDVARQAEDLYRKGLSSTGDELSALDRSESVSIYFLNDRLEILYSSSNQNQLADHNKLPREIETQISQREKTPFFGTTEKGDSEAPNIVYAKAIGENSFLVLVKSIKVIRESVIIANRFYAIAGLVSLFIGMLAILPFSRIVTQPIIRMQAVTRSLSQLNFSQQVPVHGHDELSELAESINVMSDQLQQSITTLQKDIVRHKQLVRDLSHELKAPLAVIKGYSEGLIHGLASSQDKQEQYMKTIVNECIRMDGLIQDMLYLSRLEAGTYQPNITVFSAKTFLESIIDRFAPQMQEKQCVGTLQCNPQITLNADEKLLDKAISNYLSNAVNHVHNHGSVAIVCNPINEHMEISVTNTGSPIPEEQMARIWDPFYICDTSRNRTTNGHGVGLAIVKSVAELHHAEVSCVNTEDGVQFVFSLPM